MSWPFRLFVLRPIAGADVICCGTEIDGSCLVLSQFARFFVGFEARGAAFATWCQAEEGDGLPEAPVVLTPEFLTLKSPDSKFCGGMPLQL